MALARFSDKVVLVTGGTSGLGADTAELFLEEDAKVFIVDFAERDILKRLVYKNKNVHYRKCDVSSFEGCKSASQACIERFG